MRFLLDHFEADTIAIFPVGRLHGFSKPEPQLDRWSNLHVFYQEGAHSFSYYLITPDGLLLTRQFWDINGDSRPGLKVDSEGRIAVFGGVRRVTPDDLPPPDLLGENSEPAPAGSLADKALDANTPAK